MQEQLRDLRNLREMQLLQVSSLQNGPLTFQREEDSLAMLDSMQDNIDCCKSDKRSFSTDLERFRAKQPEEHEQVQRSVAIDRARLQDELWTLRLQQGLRRHSASPGARPSSPKKTPSRTPSPQRRPLYDLPGPEQKGAAADLQRSRVLPADVAARSLSVTASTVIAYSESSSKSAQEWTNHWAATAGQCACQWKQASKGDEWHDLWHRHGPRTGKGLVVAQAWRAIHTYMQKMASDHAMAEIAAYRRRVEDELNEKCNDIIKILDSDLVPKAVSSEAKVFYLKMRGDYYRYLAEFTDGSQRDAYAAAAHESYQTANELAVPLPPTHPIRLGLALNFSVFYYEVYKYTDKACQLAKEAFENAMGDLDSLDAEQYKDSAAIMQLLRDNLALWQNDLPGDGKAEQDGTAVEDI
eukprot:s1104_g33.t1